jgi:hypothetical protein
MSQYLFSTIAQIKQHVPVAYTTLGIDHIKPFILLAQESYLKDILGSPLYDQLLDYIDPSGDSGSGSGSGSGSSDWVSDYWLERLLQKARPAIALLAYYEGLPLLEVKISKEGIHQVEGEELRPIYSTQRQRLEASLLKLGYTHLENIIVWLEAKQSHFAVWKNSDAYSIRKGAVIENAKRFTEYWGKANNNRQTFISLRSIFNEVERGELKNLLGDALFNNMLTALRSGNTTSYTSILELARPLVAYRTASDAMPHLSMAVEANGIFSPTIAKNDKNVQAMDAAIPARFSQEKERLTNLADKYHVLLKDYLNQNVSLYPDFESSSAYDAANTNTKGSIDNQDDNGIVMF